MDSPRLRGTTVLLLLQYLYWDVKKLYQLCTLMNLCVCVCVGGWVGGGDILCYLQYKNDNVEGTINNQVKCSYWTHLPQLHKWHTI